MREIDQESLPQDECVGFDEDVPLLVGILVQRRVGHGQKFVLVYFPGNNGVLKTKRS